MSEILGRPTDLTSELTMQIRGLVLKNLDYKEIQETLDIPSGTWDAWVYKDYKDFRANLKKWKHERMVKKAEIKIEALMEAEDERVALDASKFVSSTLGKEDYSTKTETDITSGGKPIFIPSEIADKNEIKTENELQIPGQ